MNDNQMTDFLMGVFSRDEQFGSRLSAHPGRSDAVATGVLNFWG